MIDPDRAPHLGPTGVVDDLTVPPGVGDRGVGPHDVAEDHEAVAPPRDGPLGILIQAEHVEPQLVGQGT